MGSDQERGQPRVSTTTPWGQFKVKSAAGTALLASPGRHDLVGKLLEFLGQGRKVAIGELGARGFDHLHEMGPLLRLNRTTDVAFGAICVDQSLALGVEDDHPRDATLAGPT